jgi:hypothetical protein
VLAAVLCAMALVIGAAAAAGAALPSGGGTASELVGYDVSFPQCGQPLPAAAPFTVVGVNGGLAYSSNPCLAAQYHWALDGAARGFASVAFAADPGPGVMLYVNTGNPGPVASKRWPAGQTWPRLCDGTWSVDCAYDYGWNAANDAFALADQALPFGVASSSAWWLDVETANSWNHGDLDTNVAALQGFVDLLSIRAPSQPVGIYSTGYQWGLITGAKTPGSLRNLPFADAPNWVAGATAKTASASCADTFTGGPVHYVQYVESGLDHDLAC